MLCYVTLRYNESRRDESLSASLPPVLRSEYPLGFLSYGECGPVSTDDVWQVLCRCLGKLTEPELDTVMILSEFQAVLASIDIGNEKFRITGRCPYRESRDDAVNSNIFVTEAMLFLSFMPSYIWDEHKCKTHDLAKDRVY